MEFTFEFLSQLFVTSLGHWYVIVPAIIIGLVIGAIPGLGPANTLIILLPFTLSLEVNAAMAFMVALYCSARMGAGIPAILVNIPGTAGAAATPFDGYPMTQKGMAQQALTMSFVASAFGGLIASIFSIFSLPMLARVGYYFHSVEMVVVMLFGLTLIAVVSTGNTLKGLIGGFFGLLVGAIGPDFIYSAPRATFGFLELYDGVPVVAALIGIFAISEALLMIEVESILTEAGKTRMAAQSPWAATWEGVRMSAKRWWHIVWTSFIGLGIGVVPGAGAPIAAFVAYQQSRLFSKHPERYGTGHPEGILAPESANNGVTSGSLIPLLTLGIPGGSTAAIMLIVIQFHGIVLGPRIFLDMPQFPYGVLMGMVVTYLFMVGTILPLARYMSRVTLIPTQYLAPAIISFTLVGAFSPRAYIFDMGLGLVFGVIGYIARKTGYQVSAILIGVILGPYVERYLMRALRISEGDPTVLFSSTIGNVLWVLLALSLILPPVIERLRKR
ncbi:MAG: tripartite tricarboxylate transporter permease [Thermodesulfobacteriota bacterium]